MYYYITHISFFFLVHFELHCNETHVTLIAEWWNKHKIKKCFLFSKFEVILTKKKKVLHKHKTSREEKWHTNTKSFVYARFTVNVDVADAFTVAQDRNTLSCPLNVPDQLGWAPWNDQVNHLVQSAQILHFLAGAHLHK